MSLLMVLFRAMLGFLFCRNFQWMLLKWLPDKKSVSNSRIIGLQILFLIKILFLLFSNRHDDELQPSTKIINVWHSIFKIKLSNRSFGFCFNCNYSQWSEIQNFNFTCCCSQSLWYFKRVKLILGINMYHYIRIYYYLCLCRGSVFSYEQESARR